MSIDDIVWSIIADDDDAALHSCGAPVAPVITPFDSSFCSRGEIGASILRNPLPRGCSSTCSCVRELLFDNLSEMACNAGNNREEIRLG